ncbi:MAG: energy transducer TonB [bacterium]
MYIRIIKKRKKFEPFASPSWSWIVKPESLFNRETRLFFEKTVDVNSLVKPENPYKNLRMQYRKIYERALTATLVLLIALFQLARYYSVTAPVVEKVDVTIEVADIPITQQFRKPLPPVRPSLPIPLEDESIPEDVTIASTEFNLSDIPAPPVMTEEDKEVPVYVVYDEPPSIIGGIAELQRHVKYPYLAAKAQVEGIVYIKVTVGVNGHSENPEIVKAKPRNLGFEEAAIEAIKKVKWYPAKQRDKNIRVFVTIPVQFKLYDSYKPL